ncbi:DUF4143 domain-containing protein, partial [Candidatus Margulisiibacteriota bacterium]
WWGRLTENAVGAKLYNLLPEKGAELFYWRDRQEEIDFIIKYGKRILAIEVKSGQAKNRTASLESFSKRYKNAELYILSDKKTAAPEIIKNISLIDFFSNPEKSLSL